MLKILKGLRWIFPLRLKLVWEDDTGQRPATLDDARWVGGGRKGD